MQWTAGFTIEEQIQQALNNAHERKLIIVGYDGLLAKIKPHSNAERINVKKHFPNESGLFYCTLQEFYLLTLRHLVTPSMPRAMPFDEIHVIGGDSFINGANPGITLPFSDYQDKTSFQNFMVSTLTLANQWIKENDSKDRYNVADFLVYAEETTGRDDYITQGWMTMAYDAMHRALFEIKHKQDFVIHNGRIAWRFDDNNGFTTHVKQDEMLHMATYLLYASLAKEQGVELRPEQEVSYTSYVSITPSVGKTLLDKATVNISSYTHQALVQSGQRLGNVKVKTQNKEVSLIQADVPATRKHMTMALTDWIKEHKNKRLAFIHSTPTGKASMAGITEYGASLSSVEYLQSLDSFDAVLIIEPPMHAGEAELIRDITSGTVTAIIDPSHEDIGGTAKSIHRILKGKKFDVTAPTPSQVKKIVKKDNNLFLNNITMLKKAQDKPQISDEKWYKVVAKGRQGIIHTAQRASMAHIQMMIAGE